MKLNGPLKLASSIGAVGIAIAAMAAISHYLGKYQPFADLIQQSESGPYANLSIVIDKAVISHRLSPTENLMLQADHVQLSRDRRQITAINIHDSYISRPNGSKIVSFSAGSADITANYGLNDAAFQGSVKIKDGVQVSSAQFPKPQVSCASMDWDSLSENVTCPGTITLNLPGYKTTLTGQDLGYDIKTGNLHVSHIHGLFHLPDAVQ